MANSKFYQRKKVIRGIEYIAQYSGLRAATQIVDSNYIDGTSNLSIEKMNDYILRNIIVSPPNLSMDDFDDIDTLNEVVKFGRDVAQGKFRDQEFTAQNAEECE